MTRRSKTVAATLLAAGTALLAAACGGDAQQSSAASQTPTIRFAVTQLKGLEELQREFTGFQQRLEQASGVKLEFFAVTDRAAAAAALQADRVDMVLTGPAEYVVMRARTKAEPVVAIQRPDYRTCVWTTRASGVTDLAGLRGKVVAMEDVGSTSAHLGPSQLLAEAGVDPRRQVEAKMVGDAMQPALERGDVAAVGAACHDYADLVPKGRQADFPIIKQGPVLPADVIVARKDLDPAVVARIRDAFRGNWPALRAAISRGEEMKKFEDARLVAIPSDRDYDVVRSMYRNVGVNDYTRFIGE